jgi:hypothetical protein
MSWIPFKLLKGFFEPLLDASFYGVWVAPNTTGVSTASLLSGGIGIACEPLGELQGLGFSVAGNAMTALGVGQGLSPDVSFKLYTRF